MTPGLIVICGPTATGKSSLALALARRLGAPILSADSRQVYRGFDIGTAKPSVTDQEDVPHYLIDICDPTETLTVADYQEQAQALIAQFHTEGQTPILVGGTGLYIRAIVEGLKIPRVPPQLELRSQLQSQGQVQIYQWLQQVDPPAAQKIHAHDQVRTLRALEVFYTTGIPLSAQQGKNPPSYPILQIGLDISDLDQHTDIIQQRTAAMVEQGWLTEVQKLIDHYGVELPLLATLGYQEMKAYLHQQITLEEATAQTILHTRQFAKRQRTWFRANSGIHWFDATNSDLLSLVWKDIQGQPWL
ncbi:tRNA (adenosine(37)-N6)-dimethylallyltransferase MiaA [Acaryochloris marina]|uniref:tRNA dimethylallyltransferase n=1 Tax=Acaryochloris marina (strain MBIC 11017) TaxID=329726 RepID=MIAA_ACAM1|nr:tRNA (adenosine(37)-N6)-dimethylallyltransferase MiaA [Acaryochloris marina]B0CG28.1 RecName: Full=tRNA dimethylallyltransferase; AltName: Full=Dimethylallyl diphosphate:tRNA dimethylallyltransferase; Short=DMAPP:tRNA dimethylallyltransferase; Short=DMATase; AltName: Full=Isopentenyl-diphosphate:tRNA isopentenyltransferase; Short=IPP transferase; Short=IPPT; Short=IPTase [Acaryochloris marina MBIC11017]ABW29475.1 tRNA delta(2)-isopentenylpyrophosphate transferase [Acaryochloris marina MBIC1101